MSAHNRPPITKMDLRHLSRGADHVETSIYLCEPYMPSELWIQLGEIQLITADRDDGAWRLGAYLLNDVDFEHDSAWLLRMELVGVRLVYVSYGMTMLVGWIRADYPEKFNVPLPDYGPHAISTPCKDKRCASRGKHKIVPEGMFVPPFDAALFERVRGLRVEIVTRVIPTKVAP